MIENISMATKNELQAEMESLEQQYQEEQSKLSKEMEAWREYVKECSDRINELAKQYTAIKEEMNKREGRNA